MTVQGAMREIGKILANNNISYCLVGGYAVSIWGAVRSTLDIDILILIDQEQLAVLKELISNKGSEVEHRKADIFDPIGDVINFIINDIPVQLICTRYQWEVTIINRAVKVEIAKGLILPVIAVEDLLIMKLRGGSFLDLHDVNNIVQIHRGKLNLEYLREMIEKLNLKLIVEKTELFAH